jgi:hypothetical protein
MAVDHVMGVAADVGTPVDHMHRMASLRAFPRHHGPGKTSANHEHPQVGHPIAAKVHAY